MSLREIAASKDDIGYKIIEQGTFGATIRFKSALNDPDVILVDRTHGADTVIERSTIRVNQNSNPLIDAYFVTANLVYYGSFDLSVGDDLSISDAAPPTIVALRWVEEESRDILRQCQTEE